MDSACANLRLMKNERCNQVRDGDSDDVGRLI
jgi:hypothetical protein